MTSAVCSSGVLLNSGCPSMAAAVPSKAMLTAQITPPNHLSTRVKRPCFCRQIMASEIVHEQGINSRRFTSIACVTPMARSPSVNCSTNCRSSIAIPTAISHRALPTTGLTVTLRGNSSNFIRSSVSTTMAANCVISIIGCKITKK